MSAKNIRFHSDPPRFRLKLPVKLRNWIDAAIRSGRKTTGELQFIFCTDAFLLDMNKRFLNHDYYTDVITFDYSSGKTVSGDIYISIDRVRDNARTEGQVFETELHRVMIHGVLHLLGHTDKSKAKKLEMRKKEDYFLSLLSPKKK